MELNLEYSQLLHQITNNISLEGVTNKEIDDLIDLQEKLEDYIQKTNNKVDKIFQSEKIERSNEAIRKAGKKAEKLMKRIEEIPPLDIKPLKIFSSDAVIGATRHYGVSVIRLTKKVLEKEVEEEQEKKVV